jgi:hypothetical protein
MSAYPICANGISAGTLKSMELAIIAFVLLVGPLALRFGADSRRLDDHGIFPDTRR